MCVVASTLSKETGVGIVAVMVVHDFMRTAQQRISNNQRIDDKRIKKQRINVERADAERTRAIAAVANTNTKYDDGTASTIDTASTIERIRNIASVVWSVIGVVMMRTIVVATVTCMMLYARFKLTDGTNLDMHKAFNR